MGLDIGLGGGILAVIIALLAYVFKLRGDKALNEAEVIAEKEELERRQQAFKNDAKIVENLKAVNSEAQKVEDENQARKGKRPSGDFGDRRL